VDQVAEKVHGELGWLFREQEKDYGVDAQIEVDEEEGRLAG
jgi:hypothetical protein